MPEIIKFVTVIDTEILFKKSTHKLIVNKIKIEKSVNDLLIKADIFYNSSLNGLRYIPIKSRISILIALRIYQAIGHKIKRTGTKFLKENIYITAKEKIFLIIKSIIEFLIFFTQLASSSS